MAYDSPQLLEFLFGFAPDVAAEVFLETNTDDGYVEDMLVRTVRRIKDILVKRRPGTKPIRPSTPWTEPIPALRPSPLTFEEQIDDDMKHLGLTGPTRNELLRTARELGPCNFDLTIALTKHASDRYSYLLSLPRRIVAHTHQQAATRPAPDDPETVQKLQGRTLRTLDILLTHCPRTVPLFPPAMVSGKHSWKRRVSARPSADLMLSPSERGELENTTPPAPSEVTHALIKLHNRFVAKFHERRAAQAVGDRTGQKLEDQGIGRKRENKERTRIGQADQGAARGPVSWAMVASRSGKQTVEVRAKHGRGGSR
ncbi:hypothetical protein VUR80DRAFT_4685 [Thermomyces stellatus]